MASAAPMSDRKAIALQALSLLDLTNLNDDCTEAAITDLCRKAQTPFGNTAAVCIWPRFVPTAKPLLKKTGIRIATVVNFPSGEEGIRAMVGQTESAIRHGADEIDMVIPYRAFMRGDARSVRKHVRAAAKACRRKARLKVIIESGVLARPGFIRAASEIALEEGADFIKTSTGKVAVNATPDAARIMLETIRDLKADAGFKPAGGIRTVDDAAAYLGLAAEILGPHWAQPTTFRFGASGVLGAIISELEGKSVAATGTGY